MPLNRAFGCSLVVRGRSIYRFKVDWLMVQAWLDRQSELDSDAFATRYADALGRELGPSDAETLEQLQLIAQSYRSEKPEDVVLQLLERTATDALLSYELGRAAAALGCHQAAILSFKQAEIDFGGPFSVERLSTRF